MGICLKYAHPDSKITHMEGIICIFCVQTHSDNYSNHFSCHFAALRRGKSRMFKNGSAEGGGKVMIYGCGRRMCQPPASPVYLVPWQRGDNALIPLPADCEEAKKKGEGNNRSSSPAWCLGVNCEWMAGVGGWGDHSYSSLLYCPVFATPVGQTVMRGPSTHRT